MNEPELLVVSSVNDQTVPWSSAQLVKRRVRLGFGTPETQAKTEQIIIAK